MLIVKKKVIKNAWLLAPKVIKSGSTNGKKILYKRVLPEKIALPKAC